MAHDMSLDNWAVLYSRCNFLLPTHLCTYTRQVLRNTHVQDYNLIISYDLECYLKDALYLYAKKLFSLVICNDITLFAYRTFTKSSCPASLTLASKGLIVAGSMLATPFQFYTLGTALSLPSLMTPMTSGYGRIIYKIGSYNFQIATNN